MSPGPDDWTADDAEEWAEELPANVEIPSELGFTLMQYLIANNTALAEQLVVYIPFAGPVHSAGD